MKWSGQLEIYPEICCDYCGDIIHNHLDCPICEKKYAPSEQYCLIEPDEQLGASEIECSNCGALFTTQDSPYDWEARWVRVLV